MDLFTAPCRIGVKTPTRHADDEAGNAPAKSAQTEKEKQRPNGDASSDDRSPFPMMDSNDDSSTSFPSRVLSALFGAPEYDQDLQRDLGFLASFRHAVTPADSDPRHCHTCPPDRPQASSRCDEHSPDLRDGANVTLVDDKVASMNPPDPSLPSPPPTLRKALLRLYGVPILVSGIIAALRTASHISAVHLLSLFLKWLTDFALFELLYFPSEDAGAAVLLGGDEEERSPPSVEEGIGYAIAVGALLILTTLFDKVGVLVSQRAFFRMRSVLTVLVAERLGKCTVDDAAPAGTTDEGTSEHETTIKQKAASLIGVRLPTLPSLGGKYFHLWWTTLCTGAAVTYLLVDALKWVGALFLPIILIGYCHLLPIAVEEGAAASAVSPVTLRRVAFINSVFDSIRVIKGNSWTQWTFEKIRALRKTERGLKFVHVFRQWLLAVSNDIRSHAFPDVLRSYLQCRKPPRVRPEPFQRPRRQRVLHHPTHSLCVHAAERDGVA